MASTQGGVRGIREAEQAYANFLASYPTHAQRRRSISCTAAQHRRLDDHHPIYVDHTGACHDADAQVAEHLGSLRLGVFRNPQFSNPTSAPITRHVEWSRRGVLKHFNTPASEYILVFGRDASAALKMV